MHSPDLFTSVFTLLIFLVVVLSNVCASILILWLITGIIGYRSYNLRWARLQLACEEAMKVIIVIGRFALVSMVGIWLAKFMLYILLVPLP